MRRIFLAISILLVVSAAAQSLTLTDVVNPRIGAGENGLLAIYSFNGSRVNACGSAGEFLRSADGGSTWDRQVAAIGGNLNCIYAIDASNIYAGRADGTVYKNTSNGDALSWTGPLILPASPLSGFKDIAFCPNGIYGIAIGDDGLGTDVMVRTANGGINWTAPVPTGMTGGSLNGLWWVDNSVVFVAGQNDPGGTPKAVIYKSADSGATWTNVYENATDIKFLDICVKDRTGVAVGPGGRMAISTDSGNSWTHQTAIASDIDLNGIYLLDEQIGLIAAGQGNTNIGRIYKNSNIRSPNSSWQIDTSYVARQITGVFGYTNNRFWFVGGGSNYIKTVKIDPAITSVTPNILSQGGTYSLTFNVANADAKATVNCGAGITINSVTWNSESSIVASVTIASGAVPGARDVTITNGSGGTATLTSAITVVAPHRIDSITPQPSGQIDKVFQRQLCNWKVLGYFPTAGTLTISPPANILIASQTRVNNTEYTLTEVNVDASAAAGTRSLVWNSENLVDTTTHAFEVMQNQAPPQLKEVWINNTKASPLNFGGTPMTVDRKSDIKAIFEGTFGAVNYNARIIYEGGGRTTISPVLDTRVSVVGNQATIIAPEEIVMEFTNKISFYIEANGTPSGVQSVNVAFSRPAESVPAIISNALVGPNPIRSFTPTPNLYFELSNRAVLKILAAASNGEIIKMIGEREYPAGRNIIEITDETLSGSRIANGVYSWAFISDGKKASARMVVAR